MNVPGFLFDIVFFLYDTMFASHFATPLKQNMLLPYDTSKAMSCDFNSNVKGFFIWLRIPYFMTQCFLPFCHTSNGKHFASLREFQLVIWTCKPGDWVMRQRLEEWQSDVILRGRGRPELGRGWLRVISVYWGLRKVWRWIGLSGGDNLCPWHDMTFVILQTFLPFSLFYFIHFLKVLSNFYICCSSLFPWLFILFLFS